MECKCNPIIKKYLSFINILSVMVFDKIKSLVVKHQCNFKMVRVSSCFENISLYAEAIRGLLQIIHIISLKKNYEFPLSSSDWLCICRVVKYSGPMFMNDNFGKSRTCNFIIRCICTYLYCCTNLYFYF